MTRKGKPGWFHFEKHHEPLAPVRRFRRRLVFLSLWTSAAVAAWLLLGVALYLNVLAPELRDFPDALLNAAMIAGGMGPVNEVQGDVGKVLAAFYALFSGVVLIGAVGVILNPIVHRIVHQFHARTD
jgi:hypothetical protein